MARKLRVQYAGAIYHVISRGDRREPIFKDDSDRERLLETLAEACQKTGWQIHAFCLMPNHLHLVVETPQPNLVHGMKWFLGTYANRFNRRHRLPGHLFGGRYKALLVDGSGSGYLRSLCDYVHLNPARARLVPPAERLASYPWSSFPMYLRTPEKRPAWLRVDRLFGEAGIPRDSTAGRRELEERMERRRREPEPEEWRELRRGWCHGSDEFKRELIEQISKGGGVPLRGLEPAESAEHRAERIVREELAKLGWSEASLAKQRKTAPEKVHIAKRLRRETVLPLNWIANRLRMGSRNTLRNALLAKPPSATAPSSAAPRKPTAPRIPEESANAPAQAAPAPGFNVDWD
jgi:REP element-mobilizing transposase RayT